MYKEAFPSRIKKAREDAGYTQVEVKQETGILQSKLSKFENGITEPCLEDLATLAQFYNVSIDWLLGVSLIPHIRPEPRKSREASQTREII